MSGNRLTARETAAALRGMDNVLLLTHVRPDGDTIGCAVSGPAGHGKDGVPAV